MRKQPNSLRKRYPVLELQINSISNRKKMKNEFQLKKLSFKLTS
jgi:hypothetical protein